MSQSDPTDNALAAIASILDNPEPATPDDGSAIRRSGDVDGYTRVGPGPLSAIRFKWTARRDGDDSYYVDETIGDHSRPITTGPMPRDQVIGFINDREREARRRFDQLKAEMTGTASRSEHDHD